MKSFRQIIDEMTVAGTGVGAYSPPLAMQTRFSSKNAMISQFRNCTNIMNRKDLLSQCRKLGLSLSHLSDEELRKSLNGMSLRNKQRFMGD
jgi:hypothetical protein